MKITNREKRDWSLLIFIVPAGIFLMMIAGQIAVRIVPKWSVQAGMQSSLDLETAPKQQSAPIQPVLPEILTPLSWFENFLTPNANSDANVVFPPFVVFEASATPAVSGTPSSTGTAPEITPTTVTATPTVPTIVATGTPTKKPKSTDTPTSTPALCEDSSADNFGDPLPCTYPPVLCTDPNANNQGQPVPCTYPTPSPAALVGVPDSGTPSGYNNGIPDGSVGGVSDGHYVIINLSATPIVVNGISDTGYDLVYYERATGNGPTLGIDMDGVIISISMDNSVYYVVFNWGDGTPDANSSVAGVAGSEADNQHLYASDLYQDPSAPTSPDTGIQIDVDNAPSHPPAGNYYYLAIQAPPIPTPPPGDGADVDSVQVLP